MSRLSDLRHALEGIPAELLDSDLEGAVRDAIASVDALDELAAAPSIVVVCGPSGSGKSTLVNALVGAEVAPVSPVRPTTKDIVAIGGAAATTISEADEIVILDSVPDGVVVVDTPAWDHASDRIGALIERAMLTIVVVTPARYGDQSVHEALDAAQKSTDMRVVANRLPAGDAEREQISDAIHERLDREPFASFVEGSNVDLGDQPLESVARVDDRVPERRVLVTALRAVCRHIVERITHNARDLNAVHVALRTVRESDLAVPVPSSVGCDADDGWSTVRSDYVEKIGDMLYRIDDRVTTVSGVPLADRIRASLPASGTDALDARLDEWEQTIAERLSNSVVPRFRRRSARNLLEREAWRLAFPGCDLPPRMARLIRRHDPETLSTEASGAVCQIAREAQETRLTQWSDAVSQVGDFQLGGLAAAVAALDRDAENDA